MISLLLLCAVLGQDARESLGPKDAQTKQTGPHPLTALMAKAPALKPELRGKHPRVFVTAEELAALKRRSQTTHRELWQRVLTNVRALKQDPAAPPAQQRRAQNETGLGIAEAAFIYKIDGDPRYLAAARRYMDAAVSYDIWGYANNKPNVDLAAGHLLYGLGWGYDLLYNDLTEPERARYRDKLTHHAKLLFEYYRPKPGRTYSYSQNHVFIPLSGLGVAAYALWDEVPEAREWAALVRAVFDRVLATYSPDGYYYEGFEYWVFSTPWIIHYLDAHAHSTGEDLFDQPGLRQSHLFMAHSMLPGAQYVFDFGDVYEGPLTRAGKGEDYKRSNPGGRLHSNYNLLYRLAARFQNPEAQGVAAWMAGLQHVSAEDYWTLVWQDPELKAQPIERLPAWHHFTDHGVIFWRTDWTASATALAFKAGPPEGHHTTRLLKAFPDWHLSAGHAHPDANSFILYAGGSTLTGDSGYAGVPLTEHHNTLLVDGRGQGREGRGHDAFAGVSYDRLDRIRIDEFELGPRSVYIRADAAAAYEPDLGVTRFDRQFLFTAPGELVVWDEVAADQPRKFTTLIHADDRIEPDLRISTSGATLRIQVEQPQGARTAIQPNLLTAPGPPGSVDKGEQQKRGERLAISTPAAVREAQFVVRLKIERK